jgi:hypothetical protein
MSPRKERGMLKERGLYPKLPEFIQLESIRREDVPGRGDAESPDQGCCNSCKKLFFEVPKIWSPV